MNIKTDAQSAESSSSSVLLAIGELLRTQDNRCTAEPMFCVQRQVTQYGMDTRWTDNPVWINTEETAYEVDPPADGKETAFVFMTGKLQYWETVMVAFTEEGCKEYIRQNGHNHRGELRIYVESFRRCPEMIAIRAFLMANAKSTEPLAERK